MVTCQFEKITQGQNQLPWVYERIRVSKLRPITDVSPFYVHMRHISFVRMSYAADRA